MSEHREEYSSYLTEFFMENSKATPKEYGGWLESKLTELQAQLEKAEAIIDKANKCSRYYIGSEYYNDPAYTIKCAEKSIDGYVEGIKTQVRRAKKAQAQLEEVRAENKKLTDALAKIGSKLLTPKEK